VYEMKNRTIYVNKLLFLRFPNSKREVDALIQIVNDDFRGFLIVSELGVGG